MKEIHWATFQGIWRISITRYIQIKNLPVHGRIIHESSITLQVKLAQSQDTQGNKGNREDQAQKRVRSAAAFSNAGRKMRVSVHRNESSIWNNSF